MEKVHKIIIGITGASGVNIAVKLLRVLKRQKNIETHLIMTKSAKLTISLETSYKVKEVQDLADFNYDNQNMAASVASGSYDVDGIIVIPCSMKTLAGIRSGYSDNLLLRTVDVNIKEQKKVILGVRETPLSSIHLDNMAYLSHINNVMIYPLMMTHYSNPTSIEDMEIALIGKILKRFNIDIQEYQPWKGQQ
ncbi:MAG: UbiX family flavin prenyltransferase [Thomasclavelia sp.]|jgi:4-hydroxy-3-polyprenylbenzoate decarboxylase|nr:UbiX family flavin prenyltransferase [Thomasclavelia sp.]